MSRRPQPILWFERLILGALAIDLASNLYFADDIAKRWAATGVALNGPGLVALCLSSPALGLLLWYLVAQRRNNFGRWLMAILVALATFGFVVAIVRATATSAPTILVVAGVSEIMKIVAVAMLFTEEASRWFSAGRAGRQP